MLSGDMGLDIIHINTAGRLLHIALTIVLLGAAWSLSEKAVTSTA